MTRARWSRRRLLLLIPLVVVVPAAVAWAFWTAGSTPGGNGAAAATTVNQGATPTAAMAGNAVTISWAASTLSSNRAVDGYAITRYDVATHTAQTTLSACIGTVAATACTENNVPAGQWTYSVTPLVGTNWRGAESAMSTTTTVLPADATAPINALSLSGLTGSAVKSGNTIYYRGAAAGSFTLTNGVSDTGSGPASSTTGALTETSTGWTHNPSTTSTPSTGPYVSAIFSWTAGTTSAPTETVTGRDVAGNTATTTLSFVDDSTAPVGGTITYTDGYQSNLSVTVAFTAASDSGSGVATSQLQRSTAPLAGGTCGTFTGFTDIGPANPTSPYVDGQVTNSTCYQYRYTVTDQLGNQASVTSANVVRVDYAGAVGATTGLLSQWRLGEASTLLTSSDSFTGTAGSTLITHTAEIGGTWQNLAGAAGTETISSEGRAYRAGTGLAAPFLPATPPSVSYAVEADLVVKSTLAGDDAGVTARLNTAAANTFYVARWEQSDTSWNLAKYVNGTLTYLGFIATQPALTVNGTYRIRLQVSGTGTASTLSLYVNGVLKVGPVTDTTVSLQTVGKAGIMDGDYSNTAIVKSATTGLHFDNFQVSSNPRAADSKGSNTGDYINGVTLGATGALAGDPNTAAQFDGINDYVQVLGSTGIPVGSSLRSVEMWFKTTSSNQQILYSYGTAGNTQEFGLWLDTGGTAMTAWGWGNGNDKTFALPAAVNNGAWHQVVETYNGTAITLYIDGVALAPQAATRATVMDSYGFGIGAVITPGDSNSGRYFTGYLDEVSLYTTVLTQATVTNHYALGTAAGDVTGPTGGSVDASGLVGTASRYSTSTTLNLVLAKGTDPSGVAASGAQLQRSTGTLTAGVCTAFSGYILINGGADPTSPTTDVVTDQACYRYQYLVADTLGHTTTYTSSDIKVSTAAPAAPSLAFSALTNSSYATGTLTYISNSATGGTFTTTATTSSSAGAASYTFSSAGTSWTSTAGSLGVTTYSWPGPTAPTSNASITVTVTDNTSRTSAATIIMLTADPLDPPATFTYTRACTSAASVSPAFKAEATAVSAVGASSLTIPVPAGTVQGDLLIAGHVIDLSGSAITAITPTGWTLTAPSQINGITSRTTTYWRFAPASPPTSYAFTFSAVAAGAAGFMASYTGADSTSPIHAVGSQANATSTTVTAPDLTALSAPTTLVTIMGVDNVATITPTTPTGMTLRAMVSTPDDFGGGDRDRILHSDQPWPSTGATNIRTSSLGANSRASVGVSILVKAAAGNVDPKIDLSWTATPDTYATGYEIIRTGGPTTSVIGRTTLTWSDTTTSASTAYTYTITTVYGSTRSATRTVNVPIC